MKVENLRQAADEMFDFIADLPSGLDGFESDFNTAFMELLKVESNDVVEVVKCKDCTMFTTDQKAVGEYWNPPKSNEGWCNLFDSVVNKEDFCSSGERKGDGQND